MQHNDMYVHTPPPPTTCRYITPDGNPACELVVNLSVCRFLILVVKRRVGWWVGVAGGWLGVSLIMVSAGGWGFGLVKRRVGVAENFWLGCFLRVGWVVYGKELMVDV